MRVTMDTIALYNYDNELFSGMIVPDIIDKDLLISNILYETAGMEVVYPNAELYKNIITAWSKMRMPTWDKLAETLTQEYDFLTPYKKIESYTEQEERTLTGEKGMEGKYSESEEVEQSSQLDWSENGNKQGSDTGTIQEKGTRTENSISDSTESGSGTSHTVTTDKETIDKEGESSKDGTDNISTSGKENRTTTSTGGSTTEATTNDSTDQTTTKKVAAFNSSTYENREQDTVNTDYESTAKGETTNNDTTTVEGTTSGTSDTTRKESGDFSENTTRNLTSTTDGTTGTTIDKNATGKITGNDEKTTTRNLQSTEHSETERTSTGKDSGTTTTTGSDSQIDKTQEKEQGTKGFTRSITGNNGNTSYQELIKMQRDVAMFNLYDLIVEEFKNRFCLLVY